MRRWLLWSQVTLLTLMDICLPILSPLPCAFEDPQPMTCKKVFVSKDRSLLLGDEVEPESGATWCSFYYYSIFI